MIAKLARINKMTKNKLACCVIKHMVKFFIRYSLITGQAYVFCPNKVSIISKSPFFKV